MDEGMEDVDSLDVDDLLFNEESLNNAALGGGILSESALLQSVDTHFVCAPAQTEHLTNISANGSLNRLAWAKPGMIARITDNGATVEITGQRYDPKCSRWRVLKPRQLEADFEDAIGLAWSNIGTELVVLEQRGKAHVFNMFPTAVNIFNHNLTDLVDDAEEMNQPVGLLWLNLSRGEKDKKKTILENVKESGKWRHEHVEGLPHPPHGVRAFCTVSRTGTFSFLFTRDTGPHKTATVKLPTSSPASTFTHAALAQTPEGRILAALHETNEKISTYSVEVTLLPSEPAPMISVEVIDPEIPAVLPYMSLANDMIAQPVDRGILTHLLILQESEYSIAHLNKPHLGPKQPATLVAAFASYNDLKDAGGNNFFGQTIIKRWQFQHSSFELHPRFGGAQNTASPQTIMQPLMDIILPVAISNMQLIEPGNAIAITSLDGSIIFYDTDTMTPIMPDISPEIVSTIGQVNMSYSPLIMSSTQCLSPHAMSLAYTDMEHKLLLASPKCNDADAASRLHDLDPSNPQDDAIAASFILSFSRSCWQQSTLDDILSSIHASIAPTSLVHIRRQLFTTLFQPKNLVPGPNTSISEIDKVPHLMIVYKALAFHLGLFNLHDPSTNPSDKIAYLWAWTSLNLRWSIAIIGDTYKSLHQPPQQNQKPVQPPVLVNTFLDLVCHNIRWAFSLYNFLFTTLLNISDRKTHPHMFDSPSFTYLLGDTDGDGTQGLVALLLNHNWSRSLLLILSRLMKATAQKAGLHVNFGKGNATSGTISAAVAGTTLGKIAKCIQSCCVSNGLTVNALEGLFDQRAHPDWWSNEEGVNTMIMERQIEMMCTGVVGDVYQGTCAVLIEEVIGGEDGLRERGEINVLNLYESAVDTKELFLGMQQIVFGDEHTLQEEIEIGARGKIRRKQKADVELYDVHKKVPIFSAQSLAVNASPIDGSLPARPTTKEEIMASQVRRCLRCGSVTDGMVDGFNKSWPRGVAFLINNCVCDGKWIVEEVGEGFGL